MKREEILECVLCHAQDFLEQLPGSLEHKVVAEDVFAELGANSIDRAVIALEVLESLSLDLPDLDIFNASSITGLVDLIYKETMKL